jgi:hypothetical protein
VSQLADYCQQTHYDGLCEQGEQLKAEAGESMARLNSLRGKSKTKKIEPEKEWLARVFNPRNYILPETKGQQEFLSSMLTGSQAKTAFALRMNCEKMCRDGGVESIGFLTLTVGEYHCRFHGEQIPREHNRCPKCTKEMNFVQVHDAAEASRRINNLNRKILPVLFERAICVTERMKSGAIHFHLLGILDGRPDIRTGLDFDAVKNRDYQSASPELRKLWGKLRAILPRYGFGRAELLPVRKTGEAVSSYISKYIEKNVANRLKEDAHKKLVRYMGWGKTQLKPNDFEWNGEKSIAWRAKTRQILALVGCEVPDKIFEPENRIKEFCCMAGGKIRPKMLDGSEAAEAFGARWAYHVNRLRSSFDTTETTPFLIWDFPTIQVVKAELYRLAFGWCKKREAVKILFSEEMPEIRRLQKQRQDYEDYCQELGCNLSGNFAKN